MTDLCQLPAHELVRMMTTGAVSCREVLDVHLARIDAVNPRLNALVAAADPEQLRRSAADADERVARGEPLGRAHGLPVVVKDVMLVSGLVCSGGSPALRAVADRDATVVARLRAEGAIVLGMTNVPEMGRGGESNNNLYGRTTNPFDQERTPGGSSGGSAALISAGGAALSVGSDGGGSIRQPSHNCGIAGLKPTHGRIPRTGSVFGDAPGIFGPFNCYGPLARSVADLQLGLSIMAGPDLGDPYAAAAPLGDPDDVDLASLRVATYLLDGISPPEAKVAAVVTAAAQAVADTGASVRWDQPACLNRTIELLWESVFLGGDRGEGFEAALAAMGATDPSEELAEFLRQARGIEFTLSEARRRLEDIDTFRLEMLSFMAGYDVIIGPAMPGPAKPHHHGLVEISDFSHLMAHNLTGWPPSWCGAERRPRACRSESRSPPGRGRTPRRWRWPHTSRRPSAAGSRRRRVGDMRFGLFIPQGWRLDLVGIPTEKHWQVMRDLADHADAGPWDSLWVYDHFHTVPVPTDEATHEAWTLMAAYAASTSRIKLGQMCTAMSYRNPVYLAKVAATTDIISGGRVQMGIGGGWYEHEWRAYGYGFPSAGVRLGRLDEGVQIMRDAWQDGKVSFAGKHYQVDGAIVAPKPLQESGIPLWIAGGGEKVTLKIAAKYAQYTNFTSEPDGFAHKSRVLAEHCREVGTDFDAIVRSANVNAIIGTSADDVTQRVQRVRDRLAGVCGDAAADAMMTTVSAPGSAAGTPAQVIESLTALRDLGCEYVICYFPEAAYDRSGIELFEREVIPALA